MSKRLEAGAVAGLAVAYPAMTLAFRGPKEKFWSRMTATGSLLLAVSALANPRNRRIRFGFREIALGLGSAAALYLLFRVGDRFARKFVPGGGEQIGDIYTLRNYAPKLETATRLATVIGPAEELFWRGLVQEALMGRYGRWTGAAIATLLYSGAHISSRNFTLFGAAGIAGAFWSTMYAAGAPMGAMIVSHSAWDIWIFLIQPTAEVPPTEVPA